MPLLMLFVFLECLSFPCQLLQTSCPPEASQSHIFSLAFLGTVFLPRVLLAKVNGLIASAFVFPKHLSQSVHIIYVPASELQGHLHHLCLSSDWHSLCLVISAQ